MIRWISDARNVVPYLSAGDHKLLINVKWFVEGACKNTIYGWELNKIIPEVPQWRLTVREDQWAWSMFSVPLTSWLNANSLGGLNGHLLRWQ
jgi:hypothetical protein